MHLHPTLTAILSVPDDLLTSKQLAEALQAHESTIARAVQGGKIEGTKMNIRGNGATMRYRITKAAAIRWLWRSTNSDRTVLRAAIDAECPELLPFLDGSLQANAEAEAEAMRQASKRPRRGHALNLLPFDPSADLFPQLTPAAKSVA